MYKANDGQADSNVATVQVTVVPSLEPRVLDDGDAGFTTTGAWTPFSGQGLGGDVTFAAAGDGSSVARWTFAVTPGQYRVAATWSPYANRATDAPYTILDGSSSLGTVRVNQELAPNDFTERGTAWESLGGLFQVSGTTLTAELSNAADEYVIADGVRLEPVVPQPTAVLDDADPGFATSGAWTHFAGQGRDGDVTFSAAGTGANTASWTFAVTPGQYRVAATWTPHPNRATDAPYTILDGGSSLGTVRVNQELAPNDFTESTTAWKDLGTFTVAGTVLTVRLTDQADEYVIADAVRVERILAGAPDVQVFDGATAVYDNTGRVDFGAHLPGAPGWKTLTVRNAGTATLTLGSLGLPGGFGVLFGFGKTVLAPGDSTTFTVRFDAAVSASGRLAFVTNDPDEAPFDFAVAGTVTPSTVIDDGDFGGTGDGPGFDAVGTWTRFVGQGFGGDVTFAAAGDGSSVARWNFDVAPGQYRIAATWTPHPNRATNAPYRIIDGYQPLLTVKVNQQLAPDDFTADGAAWESLAGLVRVNGTRLVVELTNAADGYVIADAIRVERVMAQPLAVLDDGGTGFRTTSGWTHYVGQGFGNDVHAAPAGTGSAVAQWVFAVTPGQYRVSATWSPHENRATNAPFRILSDGTALTTVRVNQEQGPDDFTDGGVSWKNLGGNVLVTGTTLTVELSDDADEFVVADAIRLERLGDLP